MWKDYKVSMEFLGRLCGSVPQSKELVSVWLDARKPKRKPDDAKPLEEIEQEVLDSIDQEIEKTTVGFQHDDTGLYVRGATIRAHIKDCANQIKDLVKVKAFRAKVANRVYIEQYKVYLCNNGTVLKDSHGTFEQPIHAMTPKGPINALKCVHYVEGARLEFTMKVLDDGNKEVTLDKIKKIFEYGQVHGYGGERSMGEGRYLWEILEI